MAQARACGRADAGGARRRAGGSRRRAAVVLDPATRAGPFARRARRRAAGVGSRAVGHGRRRAAGAGAQRRARPRRPARAPAARRALRSPAWRASSTRRLVRRRLRSSSAVLTSSVSEVTTRPAPSALARAQRLAAQAPPDRRRGDRRRHRLGARRPGVAGVRPRPLGGVRRRPACTTARTCCAAGMRGSPIPTRPMPAGCQRSPSTGRSKCSVGSNPAPPARLRRCVDVVARYADA